MILNMKKFSNQSDFRKAFYDMYLKDENKEEISKFLDKIAKKMYKLEKDYKFIYNKLRREKDKIKNEIMNEKKEQIYALSNIEVRKEIRDEFYLKEQELKKELYALSEKEKNLKIIVLDQLENKRKELIKAIENEWIRVSVEDKFDIDDERTRGYLIAIRKSKKIIDESFSNIDKSKILEVIDNKKDIVYEKGYFNLRQ